MFKNIVSKAFCASDSSLQRVISLGISVPATQNMDKYTHIEKVPVSSYPILPKLPSFV